MTDTNDSPKTEEHCRPTNTDGDRSTSGLLDRRIYLKFTSAAVVSGMASTAATGGAAAATTRHGITFNTVVDMADERGNNEKWTEAMKRLAGDDTLLKFPDQDIPIDNYNGGATESAIELKGNNFGMLGQSGTRFVFPSDYNYSIALNTNGTTNTNVLFENIDIDLTAENSTPGLVIKATDNLQVHDVEYIGAGDTESADVQNALMPTLTEGGSGTIKNVTALNEGELYSKHDGNARVGIYIGPSNYGTITIKNCRFEGFPNNGLYTSRTHGTVHVEGGVYRNNDVSQVRLASDGSYVRGATIEVDPSKSNSPNPYGGHGRFGVKIDGRKPDRTDVGDVEVDDCDIRINNSHKSGGSSKTSGAVGVWYTTGKSTIKNCRISWDNDGEKKADAVVIAPEDREPEYGPAGPVVVRGTSLTGTSSVPAVDISEHANNAVENCCISMPNGGDIKVADSNKNNNTRDSDSCPAPNIGDGGSGGGDGRVLTISGTGSKATYSFTVDGSLNEESGLTGEDSINGSGATGVVGGGDDSYRFTGGVTTFDLDGNANVSIDGSEIDPAQYPGRILTIEGTGTGTSYQFSVSGDLGKSTANGGSINSGDDISGSTASGKVGGGNDSYVFSGDVESFSLDGNADVLLNGEQVDPNSLGQTLPNRIIIEGKGNGESANYSFDSSTGEIREADGSLESDDEIRPDKGPLGNVGPNDRDAYEFSGTLNYFSCDGPVKLEVSGQ